MNSENNKETVEELIKKFEEIGIFQIKKELDKSKPETFEIKNNINDDSKWLKEIEKGFSDDENTDDNIFSNVDEKLSDDDSFNSFTGKNALNRYSESKIHSCHNYYVSNFDTKNDYSQIQKHLSTASTSGSSSSTTLSLEGDILTPIIDELISTEKNFVNILHLGLENYSKIFDEENLDELPKSLIGKKDVLFRNIIDILDFHENEFLPMLLVNDYKTLFEKISKFVDENKFYSHLLYNMNKNGATQLVTENQHFFKEFEQKIGDRLGINSFLLQPVIRLTKYPLLLKEIIKKCFKSFENKLILKSCCVAEKKLSDFLTIINESEQINDIEKSDYIDISHQGRFKKVDTFNVYNNNLELGYPGKLFLFEKSIIYTEITDNMLIYRGYYPFDNLGINVKNSQFTIYFNKPGIQECTFSAELVQINLWTKLIRDHLKQFFSTTKTFRHKLQMDKHKAENVEFKHNIDDDCEWLQEIEKGFSDDEIDNNDNDNNIANADNQLSDDDDINQFTRKNSLIRPVLRSKTETYSQRKHNIKKFYSENDYAEFKFPKSETSSSETMSSDKDIIAPIIEEFISTEKNFVKQIRFGLENYSKLFEEDYTDELPKSLIGKQYVLFRNIEDILDFHENEFLPMLIDEQNDYKMLFEKISKFVDENKFYSHLLYNMNKKGASKLCADNRDFFKEYAIKISDKLDIINFIMTPVIRLTKYPLFLKEIMKKCLKNYEDKLVLQSCYLAEKKLSDFLSSVNESEQVNDIEECINIDLAHQGRFKKVDTFNVYNNNIKRGYPGKLFLFEKSIIYTEIINNTIIYRGNYPFENLGINVKENQFTIYFNKQGIQECIFRAEKVKIDLWTKLIRDSLKDYFLTRIKNR